MSDAAIKQNKGSFLPSANLKPVNLYPFSGHFHRLLINPIFRFNIQSRIIRISYGIDMGHPKGKGS